MRPTVLNKRAICKKPMIRRVSMRPTKAQRRAIYTKGNVIVSAGAGSGKTSVMIERIVDKLKVGKGKDGAKLSQMLIVTFTRASAADMRVKLTKKLTKLKKEDRYRAIASAALDDLSVCNIGTLHSYCQRIIKTYFYAADIDPSAVVCDDSEAEAMMSAAVADAVDRALDSADPDFLDIYDMLVSRKNDNNITKAVSLILSFALSTPDPRGYLADVKPDSEFFARLDRDIEQRKAAVSARIPDLRERLATNGLSKFVTAIDEFEDYMDGIVDEIPRTSLKNEDPLSYLNDEYKALKTECGNVVKTAGYYAAAKSRSGEKYARALCNVALAALDGYTERKKRLGKIDYSDLEHGAYKVLCDEQCLREITESVRYVFVDEFQDVNPLQNAIVGKFKERFAVTKGELFVVGDVKQSIYGFRRCSPEHFEKAIQDKSFTHIALTDNFRSSEPVIDFVNKVFSNVMTANFGGAEYADPRHTLVWANKKMGSAADPECDAEFVTVSPEQNVEYDKTLAPAVYEQTVDSISSDMPGDGEGSTSDIAPDSISSDVGDNEDGERDIVRDDVAAAKGFSVIGDRSAADKVNIEAKFVADSVIRYIRGFLIRGENAVEKRGEVGTIAVLVRSTKGPFVSALSTELRERGVSFSLEKKSSVADFPEAVMLVDILRCLDNRYDDPSLFTALRSPMGGFTDAQIAEIADAGARIAYKKHITPLFGSNEQSYSLWQRISAYKAMGGDEVLRKKLSDFLTLRERLIEASHTRDCADTLGYITGATDYFQYVYETGGNAQAVQTLLDFAAACNTDVHSFLNFYDETAFKMSIKSGVATVIITTIHASKGLEYDYVIVADSAKQFNDEDMKKNLIVSERGVAVRIPDRDTDGIVDTAPFIAEKLDHPERAKSEELRMLYVALTRAKKRLTVCGTSGVLESVDPPQAKRLIDFMRNIVPTQWDGFIIPKGGDNAIIPTAARRETVKSAVSAGIQKLKDYNENRENNAVPIKASVTAIAHETADGEDVPDGSAVNGVYDGDRDFSRRGKKRGAVGDNEAARRRGTAYHRAFELIDFSTPNIDGIKDDCDDFDLLDEKLVIKGAKKMHELASTAEYISKERYFIAALPAKMLYGKGEGDALVQGIIDLMIVYPDGSVTIVDYKTGNPSAVRDDPAYKKQLSLYAAAVERAVPDYKVTRLCLYAIESGEIFDV